MSIDPSKSLQAIAAEVPGAIAVLDRLGIDYCCGGRNSLAAVCRERGLPPGDVLALLEEGSHVPGASQGLKEWAGKPLSDLTRHIVSRHHAFNRRELDRLEDLFAHILTTENRRQDWKLLHNVFEALSRKVRSHMELEEQIVFPQIRELEEAAKAGAADHGAQGKSVQRPVRMMMLEHDSVCELMKRLREISSNFEVPADASRDCHVLHEGLRALDLDLHQHIFLENCILFPRAVNLDGLSQAAAGKSNGQSPALAGNEGSP